VKENKRVTADGCHEVLIEHDDGNLEFRFSKDVAPLLDANEKLRNSRAGLTLAQVERGALGFHLARIDADVVQLWKQEGYDLYSPERSGMTKEEHEAELLRRLQGDWSKFNVSKYKRLI
jgi:hypothetical protein